MTEGEEQEARVEGRVHRLRFQSEDGRFQVVVVRDGTGRDVTVRAIQAGLRLGDEVLVRGRWERWKSGERQIAATGVERRLPVTADGLVRYLASGRFPGIGEKKARAIVDHFGERSFDVLDHHPRRLREVSGMGAALAERLHGTWKSLREERALQIHLRGLGLTESEIRRMHRVYGGQTLAVLTEDPYRLAREVRGIGFLTADAIAHRMGITSDDPRRVAAACLHALHEAERAGHLCLPAEHLVEAASRWTQSGQVESAVDALIARNEVVRETHHGVDFLYAQRLHALECAVAERLAARSGEAVSRWQGADIEAVVHSVGLTLDSAQREALASLSGALLGVLTGGPGTGKTTMVRLLVALARRKGWRMRLAAPTGRAAQRLQESTGESALTLHRLLEYQPRQGFQRDEENPLELDILLIDESSMVDMELMHRVLLATPPNAMLLLVGDADQLPSVGAGEVLLEIVRSSRFPVARLQRVYRQSAGSSIAAAASRVLEGVVPTPDEGPGGDFFVVRASEPEALLDRVHRLVTERIPDAFGLHPRDDVQVLVPMRGGNVGTAVLNDRLQEALNPEGPTVSIGRHVLRPGDKVMQVRNNYDLDVFNGDVGVVGALQSGGGGLEVAYGARVVAYGEEDLEDLEPAWAMTIHKSQGSEFPAVVVVLSTAHFVLLQRRLLYTAMTRARRLLVLVVQEKALRMAIDNVQGEARYGHLAYRIDARASINPGG